MNSQRMVDLITKHEGKRKHVYKCSAGYETIGVGRNISESGLGLSDGEIDFLLRNDLTRVQSEVANVLECYDSLSDVRQAVVIDMCFNLGLGQFLRFQNMIAALENGDYIKAAAEMLDSRWAKQVGKRAETLSSMMVRDKWPE